MYFFSPKTVNYNTLICTAIQDPEGLLKHNPARFVPLQDYRQPQTQWVYYITRSDRAIAANGFGRRKHGVKTKKKH